MDWVTKFDKFLDSVADAAFGGESPRKSSTSSSSNPSQSNSSSSSASATGRDEDSGNIPTQHRNLPRPSAPAHQTTTPASLILSVEASISELNRHRTPDTLLQALQRLTELHDHHPPAAMSRVRDELRCAFLSAGAAMLVQFIHAPSASSSSSSSSQRRRTPAELIELCAAGSGMSAHGLNPLSWFLRTLAQWMRTEKHAEAVNSAHLSSALIQVLQVLLEHAANSANSVNLQSPLSNAVTAKRVPPPKPASSSVAKPSARSPTADDADASSSSFFVTPPSKGAAVPPRININAPTVSTSAKSNSSTSGFATEADAVAQTLFPQLVGSLAPLRSALGVITTCLIHLSRFASTAPELVRSNTLSILFQFLPSSSSSTLLNSAPSSNQTKIVATTTAAPSKAPSSSSESVGSAIASFLFGSDSPPKSSAPSSNHGKTTSISFSGPPPLSLTSATSLSAPPATPTRFLTPVLAAQYDIGICLLRALATGGEDLGPQLVDCLALVSSPSGILEGSNNQSGRTAMATSSMPVVHYFHRHALLLKLIGALEARESLGAQRVASIGVALKGFITGEAAISTAAPTAASSSSSLASQSGQPSAMTSSVLLDDFRVQLGYEAIGSVLSWMDEFIKKRVDQDAEQSSSASSSQEPELPGWSLDDFQSAFSELLSAITRLVFVGTKVMEQSCVSLLQAYSAAHLTSTGSTVSPFGNNRSDVGKSKRRSSKSDSKPSRLDRLRNALGLGGSSSDDDSDEEERKKSQQTDQVSATFDAHSANEAMCIRNLDALAVLERVLLQSCSAPSQSSSVSAPTRSHTQPASSIVHSDSAASFASLSVANALLVLLSHHPFNLPLLQAMRTLSSCIEVLPTSPPDVQHVILKMVEYQVENTIDTADAELSALVTLLQPQTITTITTNAFSSTDSPETSFSTSVLATSSSSRSSTDSAGKPSSSSSRRSMQQHLMSPASSSASWSLAGASPLDSFTPSPLSASRSPSGTASPRVAPTSQRGVPLSSSSSSIASSTTSTRVVWPNQAMFRQVLELLSRLLQRDQHADEFKDVLRRCGLADLLLLHCQAVGDHLFSMQSPFAQGASPTFMCEEVYCAGMDILHMLLEKNYENARHFRQSNGRLAMLRLLRSHVHRAKALKVLQLFADDDNISDMLMVLQNSKHQHAIQLDVMRVLLQMLQEGAIPKDTWLHTGGFEAVFAVISSLYGSFDAPGNLISDQEGRGSKHRSSHHSSSSLTSTTLSDKPSAESEKAKEQIFWPVLEACFSLLTESIKEHPFNRLHLWHAAGWTSLGDLLSLSGVLTSKYAHAAFHSLLNLATETSVPFDSETAVMLDISDPSLFSPHAVSPSFSHQASSEQSSSSTSRRIIANPSAILLLIACLAQNQQTVVQAAVMRSLVSLLNADVWAQSPRNKESLASVGMVGHFIHYFGSVWLSQSSHPMRPLALAFVEGIASHRLSSAELSSLLTLMPNSLNESLLRIVAAKESCPHIELDMNENAHGYACVDIPLIGQPGKSFWPSGAGVSFACWFQIRQLPTAELEPVTPVASISSSIASALKSPFSFAFGGTMASSIAQQSPVNYREKEAPPLWLFEFTTAVGHNLLSACIVDGKLHIRSSPSGSSPASAQTVPHADKQSSDGTNTSSVPEDTSLAVFHQFEFIPQQWYHIAIVHERGRLMSNSTVTLFVDGVLIATQRLSYPAADKRSGQPSMAARGFLGTAPHRKSPSSLIWWLGPTFLFASCLGSAQIAHMAQRGPKYAGTFAAYRSTQAGGLSLDDATVKHDEESDSRRKRASSSNHPNANIVGSNSSGNSAASISFENVSIMFSFHAHAFFPLHQLAPLLQGISPSTLVNTLNNMSIANSGTGPSNAILSEGLKSVIAFAGASAPGILLPNSSAPPLHPTFLAYLQQHEQQQRNKYASSAIVPPSTPAAANTNIIGSMNSPNPASSAVAAVTNLFSPTSGSSHQIASASSPLAAVSTMLDFTDEFFETAWPAGFLSGGAFPLLPLNLSDAIRMIGGMSAVLPLLAKAQTASAFRQALVLIGAFLYQNPKNMREMTRIQGYEMVASMLAQRSSWIDEEVLEVVFAMCEGRDYLQDAELSGHSQWLQRQSSRSSDALSRIGRLGLGLPTTDLGQVVYFERDHNFTASSVAGFSPSYSSASSASNSQSGATSAEAHSDFTRHIIRSPAGSSPYSLVANVLACKHVLLDFQTWRGIRADLQAKVIRRLAHLCFLGPRCADVNTPLYAPNMPTNGPFFTSTFAVPMLAGRPGSHTVQYNAKKRKLKKSDSESMIESVQRVTSIFIGGDDSSPVQTIADGVNQLLTPTATRSTTAPAGVGSEIVDDVEHPDDLDDEEEDDEEELDAEMDQAIADEDEDDEDVKSAGVIKSLSAALRSLPSLKVRSIASAPQLQTRPQNASSASSTTPSAMYGQNGDNIWWSECVQGDEAWNAQRLKQIGVWTDLLSTLSDPRFANSLIQHADGLQQHQQSWRELFQGLLLDGVGTPDLNAILSMLASGVASDDAQLMDSDLLMRSYAVTMFNSTSHSAGGDPVAASSTTSFSTSSSSTASVTAASRRMGFLLSNTQSSSTLPDVVSTPSLLKTPSLSINTPFSGSNHAVSVLCAELIDALSMSVVQSAQHGPESHFFRIVRQLESIDLRWFSLFFTASVEPVVVHAVLKLLCALLFHSTVFVARFQARSGFEILRSQLINVPATPELYALLLALLFGVQVDSVLRQGSWVGGDSFDAATLRSVFLSLPTDSSNPQPKVHYLQCVPVLLALIRRVTARSEANFDDDSSNVPEMCTDAKEISLALETLEFLHALCPFTPALREQLKTTYCLSLVSSIASPLFVTAAAVSSASELHSSSMFSEAWEDPTLVSSSTAAAVISGVARTPSKSSSISSRIAAVASPTSHLNTESMDFHSLSGNAVSHAACRFLCRIVLQSLLEDDQPLRMFEFVMNAYPLSLSLNAKGTSSGSDSSPDMMPSSSLAGSVGVAAQLYQARVLGDVLSEVYELLQHHSEKLDLEVSRRLVVHTAGILHWLLQRLAASQLDALPAPVAAKVTSAACFVLHHADFLKKMLVYGGFARLTGKSGSSTDPDTDVVDSITSGLSDAFDSIRRKAASLIDDSPKYKHGSLSTMYSVANTALPLTMNSNSSSTAANSETERERTQLFSELVDSHLRRCVQRVCLYMLATSLEHDSETKQFFEVVNLYARSLFGPDSPPSHAQSFVCMTITYCYKVLVPGVDNIMASKQHLLRVAQKSISQSHEAEHEDPALLSLKLFESYAELLRTMVVMQKPWMQTLFGFADPQGSKQDSNDDDEDGTSKVKDDLFSDMLVPLLSEWAQSASATPSKSSRSVSPAPSSVSLPAWAPFSSQALSNLAQFIHTNAPRLQSMMQSKAIRLTRDKFFPAFKQEGLSTASTLISTSTSTTSSPSVASVSAVVKKLSVIQNRMIQRKTQLVLIQQRITQRIDRQRLRCQGRLLRFEVIRQESRRQERVYRVNQIKQAWEKLLRDQQFSSIGSAWSLGPVSSRFAGSAGLIVHPSASSSSSSSLGHDPSFFHLTRFATSSSSLLSILTSFLSPSEHPAPSVSTSSPSAALSADTILALSQLAPSACTLLCMTSESMDALSEEEVYSYLQLWWSNRRQIDFTESPARQRVRMQDFNREFYRIYQLSPREVLKCIRHIALRLWPNWRSFFTPQALEWLDQQLNSSSSSLSMPSASSPSATSLLNLLNASADDDSSTDERTEDSTVALGAALAAKMDIRSASFNASSVTPPSSSVSSKPETAAASSSTSANPHDDDDDDDESSSATSPSSTSNDLSAANDEQEEDAAQRGGKYERIMRLLEPGDAMLPGFLFNCARIQGLDKHDGVVIGCRRNLYIIDQFFVNADGLLEEDTSAAEQPVKFKVHVAPRQPRGSHSNTHHHSHASSTSSSSNAVSAPDHHSVEEPITQLALRVDKLSVQKGQPQPTIRKPAQCLKWSYKSIREIHKRRYQLQAVGIEFFHVNGTNFLLVFPSMQHRDSAYEKIMKQDLSDEVKDASMSSVQQEAMQTASQGGDSAQALQITLESGSSALSAITATLTGSLSFRSLGSSALFKKSVTQRWVEGEMSNFAYLMYLNTLAGRSYNDLTQYPVFPWVLQDYKSDELDLTNPDVYRDLSKPMGAIGENRALDFQRRYESWDDPEIPAFHYGTHYSSSAGVLYYLIRLEPYTKIALELQGGKFDHADRLFFSISHSWFLSSSAGGMSDVKELTPEFYCLPDFLVNANHWDLGETQKGVVVDDVVLPPWAKGDAQRFIRLHRAALESDYVSANLHKWIDLIFGHAQRGPAAVEAQNVFYYMTYQGAVDVDSITDPVEKMSTISQINNFGQTPLQLFTKPHPSRQVLSSSRASLSSHPELLVGTFERKVPGGKVSAIWFNANKSPASTGAAALAAAASASSSAVVGGMSPVSSPSVDGTLLAVAGHKALIAPKFNKFISWGWADRSLRVCILTPSPRYPRVGAPIVVHEHLHEDSQISCATVTSDGQLIIVGGEDSVMSVWRRHEAHKYRSLRPVGTLCGHTGAITCLTTSTAFRVLVSGGADKQVMVWDLNRMQLVTRLPDVHSTPIAALCIDSIQGEIVTASGCDLFLWSINGQLITRHRIGSSLLTGSSGSSSPPPLSSSCMVGDAILSVAVAREANSVIITGHQDGSIRFFTVQMIEDDACSLKEGTMMLVPRHHIPHAHRSPVTCLHTSAHDLTRLWSGDAGGDIISWSIKEYYGHWVPDEHVSTCAKCKSKFGPFLRKHHCRKCGQVFCDQCSTKRVPVPALAMFSPVRVCDDCFEAVATES